MEATALCIRLLMNVLLLTAAQIRLCSSQKDGFPRVDPNRQQHYEYEAVALTCEGLDGWRVMRKIKVGVTICATHLEMSTGPCTISTAYSSDSGAYWCEAGDKRSSAVNITITAGPVILESPALPVMAGDTVTLRCRNKMSSNLTADFYKDGRLFRSNTAGNLTLHSVFKSHEGLYKCNVSQTEESAESWLTVTAFHTDAPLNGGCCSLSTALQIVGVASLVFLGLVLGLLQLRKRYPDVSVSVPSSSSCRSDS